MQDEARSSEAGVSSAPIQQLYRTVCSGNRCILSLCAAILSSCWRTGLSRNSITVVHAPLNLPVVVPGSLTSFTVLLLLKFGASQDQLPHDGFQPSKVPRLSFFSKQISDL